MTPKDWREFWAIFVPINKNKICFSFTWVTLDIWKTTENNTEMHGCFISKLFLFKETLIKVIGWCSLWSVSSEGYMLILSTSSLKPDSKKNNFNLPLSPAPECSLFQRSVNNWPATHCSTKANRSICHLWVLIAERGALLPFASYHRGPGVWINSARSHQT